MRLFTPQLLVVALTATPVTCALAAPTGLDHNRYKWHDANGSLHYADMLPPEAAKFGYDVVNAQGIVVKHVDRAKTADEMAASKSAQKKAQSEREQADAVARADTQLLSGYPEEADLKRSQQQKLELLDQQVIAAEISLRAQEQTLADMLGRAAEAERGGKTLPEAQAGQLAKMRKQVDDQRAAVGRRENERQQASGNFELEITRYRALKAKLSEQKATQ